MKNFNNNINPLATREKIANKATFGFNHATLGLNATLGNGTVGLVAYRIGKININTLLNNERGQKRSIHTNVRRVLNTSNMGPAPSTLFRMRLEKLATTSIEAREMLNLINTKGKLKANQKKFYSSSPSGRVKNSKI